MLKAAMVQAEIATARLMKGLRITPVAMAMITQAVAKAAQKADERLATMLEKFAEITRLFKKFEKIQADRLDAMGKPGIAALGEVIYVEDFAWHDYTIGLLAKCVFPIEISISFHGPDECRDPAGFWRAILVDLAIRLREVLRLHPQDRPMKKASPHRTRLSSPRGFPKTF